MAKLGGHHHHHRQQHLPSSISSCFGLRRRNYVLVLLVLVGVLVLNMLLLMPQLHATDSSGWHLVGFSSAAGQSAAAAVAGSEAAASAAAAAAAAGKTMKASTLQQAHQLIQQQQAQQLGKARGPGSIAAGEFVSAFDANADGVLGPAEFQTLVQEACRNDRASLPLLQRLRRLVRLALGLSPAAGSSSSNGDAYPCTLAGELLDGTRQAAAAITGGGGSRDAAAGSRAGGSSSRGRTGGGVDSVRTAKGSAGASTVDPDSLEGRAAAESATLLAGCSRLSPELAAAAASSDGLVLLAAADWSMFELFGVNWLAAVQKAGLDNYLIAALDQRTADFLRANKLGHCLLWSSHAGTSAAGDGPLPKQAAPYQHASPAHRAASWAKLQAGSLLLSWGYDVLLSDLDTVWLADPAPFLARSVPQQADLVLATDSPADAGAMAAADGGLLLNPQATSSVNPAVAYIRATPASRAVLAAWLAQYASVEGGQEVAAGSGSAADDDGLPGFPAAVARAWLRQPGFAHPHPAEPSRLLQLTAAKRSWLSLGAARRQVAVALFSPVAVANGYSWFVQGVGSRAAAGRGRAGAAGGVPGRGLPVAVHLSRAGASREGRLHRMREAQWYADGPRYYTEPKLMGFSLQPFSHPDVDSGAAAARSYPPSQLLALHLDALQHQLGQLYAAAAAAVALGRVLVMPQLQCFCYRDPDSGRHGPAPWLAAAGGSSSSGWSCRAPGDDASQMPFNCTLDQFMSPELMYRHPAVFAGRPLNFREASFLSNGRTPSWVRHAATAISSGTPLGCEGGAKCAQALPRKPPEGVNQQVVVPAGLTDVELGAVLAPFAAAKYLHFNNMTAVFGSFANPNHRIEYERYLDQVVQPWCCKPAGGAAAAAGSAEQAGAAAAAGGEVVTAVPGWAMVDVKARPSSSSSSSSSQKPR